jgi:8-oxo-dGTP diphosphatase
MGKIVRVTAAVICRENKIFATQRGYGDYKDWWEFPGGKIEPGESPEQALKREILEELAAEISVGRKIMTVEYDYPTFHLSMDCFVCTLIRGEPELLEHEAAKWLSRSELDSVPWLPADREVVDLLRLSDRVFIFR